MAVNESSREAYKLQKKEKQEEHKHVEKKNKVRLRLIPIWLRVIIVIALIFISAIAGAAVGYGVLGNGKVTDIFDSSTWTHMIDLVQKEK
jgi:hypothetical protein